MITKYFSGNKRFQAPYIFRTAHPVCNNNGKLSGVRAGGDMGRHKSVGHGVGINFRFVVVKGFDFSDEGIEGFEIVFVDAKLNTGGVKGEEKIF